MIRRAAKAVEFKLGKSSFAVGERMSKAKDNPSCLTQSKILIEAMIVLLSGRYVHLSKSRRTYVYWCKVSSIVSTFLLMEHQSSTSRLLA